MGIYDREYYRREGPSYLDRLKPTGAVTTWLIVINIFVFLLQLITAHRDDRGGPITNALLLDTEAVLNGQVWRLLTHAFLHSPDTLFHILFNMWFLGMLGGDLEQIYGRREFLAFYLIAAVAGGVGYVLAYLVNLQVGLFAAGQYALGASGAVTAVMLLYAIYYPSRPILVFFVLPAPIWALVVFQVVQDTFLFLKPEYQSGVGVSAHLAGAAFAALYYVLQWRLTGIGDILRSWTSRRARPRLRIYHGDAEARQPVAVAAPPASAQHLDEHLEAKLDAILEKVARSGQASLTDTEKQILMRASEIYKKKRT
jgi:membrane associated rhomboid family serine protease